MKLCTPPSEPSSYTPAPARLRERDRLAGDHREAVARGGGVAVGLVVGELERHGVAERIRQQRDRIADDRRRDVGFGHHARRRGVEIALDVDRVLRGDRDAGDRELVRGPPLMTFSARRNSTGRASRAAARVEQRQCASMDVGRASKPIFATTLAGTTPATPTRRFAVGLERLGSNSVVDGKFDAAFVEVLAGLERAARRPGRGARVDRVLVAVLAGFDIADVGLVVIAAAVGEVNDVAVVVQRLVAGAGSKGASWAAHCRKLLASNAT